MLLGGEPGIGKSTLLLQAGRGLAQRARDVLYASAEESVAAGSPAGRAARASSRGGSWFSPRPTFRAFWRRPRPARRPWWSSTPSRRCRSPELSSAPGTVSQVRARASELTRYAKRRGVPVLLVGHVTKDGSLAGPKSLEHLVDAVVSIEGDRSSSRRLLRATKNRFGPVDEIALYEMTGEGLSELPGRVGDAAGRAPRGPARQRRHRRARGHALAAGRDPGARRARPRPGRRAASRSGWTAAGWRFCSRFSRARGSPSPRARSSSRARAASRSPNRRRIWPSSPRSSRRPAALPLPDASVFFGEIGLLGEVRRVPAAVSRLKEASALGFRTVYPAVRQRRATPPRFRIWTAGRSTAWRTCSRSWTGSGASGVASGPTSLRGARAARPSACGRRPGTFPASSARRLPAAWAPAAACPSRSTPASRERTACRRTAGCGPARSGWRPSSGMSRA